MYMVKTTSHRLMALRKARMKRAHAKASKHAAKQHQMEFMYPQDSKYLMSQLEKESTNRHSIG